MLKALSRSLALLAITLVGCAGQPPPAAVSKPLDPSTAFLAQNAKRPEVVVTSSGLQYEVVHRGSGQMPTRSDRVRISYEGRLPDGEVFDRGHYGHERSIAVPLTNLIAGLVEGIQLMPAGSTFTFYISSSLAYGDRGAGTKIGPGQALVFEVELLNIESP